MYKYLLHGVLQMTAVESPSVIVTSGLGKSVTTADGQSLSILSDISLKIQAGESVAIVGASGSGKSTLLGLLAGLDSSSSGSVVLLQSSLEALDEDARASLRLNRVGFVYQAFNLMDNLTALENVMLPLELDRHISDPQHRAKVALDQVGLSHRLQHLPGQLSGGEQQRVALARAFVTGPEVLFADEPTGNLDAATGQEIIDRLFHLQQQSQTTLIMVTHDEQLAARCDRQLHLHQGRLRDGGVKQP
jgi:putative ABC transport system ATP-binding protein